MTGLVVLGSLVVTLASARTSEAIKDATTAESNESLGSAASGDARSSYNFGERHSLSLGDVSEHGTSFAVYKRTGTKLRLRILLVVVAASCVFHAILLASILDASSQVSSKTACAITPSFALGLIIIVLLLEGQGVYMFASFGLQPEILHAVRRWPQKLSELVADNACLRRACCLPTAGGGGGYEEEGVEKPLALMKPQSSNASLEVQAPRL